MTIVTSVAIALEGTDIVLTVKTQEVNTNTGVITVIAPEKTTITTISANPA